MLGVVLFMVTLYSALISGTELTFELPDKEKQCFYEELEEGVTFHVDYQVRYQLIQLKFDNKFGKIIFAV